MVKIVMDLVLMDMTKIVMIQRVKINMVKIRIKRITMVIKIINIKLYYLLNKMFVVLTN